MPTPPSAGTPLRVLVADDHLAICVVVRALLHQRECRVDFARDGAEAVRKIEQATPDVLIVDYMMPVADGAAVLEHLRLKRPALLSRSIIMSAAHADAEALCRKYGCAVLKKPFVGADFFAVFDSVAAV